MPIVEKKKKELKKTFDYVLISISSVLRYEPAVWKPKIGIDSKEAAKGARQNRLPNFIATVLF